MMMTAKLSGISKNAKVYSYVRFSTALQRKGRGKARQDSQAEVWCKANGYKLEPANAYADLGVSAHKSRNATHGDLKRFLDAVEQGSIKPGSILLVESLDRLSRDNINKALELFLSIINSGIIVVTLVDDSVYRADADPHTLMAQMMISLAIFLRANDESRMKSVRKADSWKAKRAAAVDGDYHGGQTPRWIDVIKGEYQVIEKEAKIVRDIFEDYCHHNMGLYKLTEKYGVPSPTIGYWLDNPVVTGTLVVKEGDAKVEIAKHYPAIISPKLWRLARQRRAERYIERKGAVGKYINLFRGILTDPKGQRMTIAQHNGGVNNFLARGCILRAKYLEEVIVLNKLSSRFMRVTDVQDNTTPKDLAKLAAIEENMLELQKEMSANPMMARHILPSLKALADMKSTMAKQEKVMTEKVDVSTISKLLSDPRDTENRVRLQGIVRQTIAKLRLTKIESQNWYQQVHGEVITHDGVICPFSYVYNTRRDGYIITDGHPKFFFEGKADNATPTPTLDALLKDEEFMADLNEFPLRKREIEPVGKKRGRKALAAA